jgi:hypothetical protein
MPLEHFLEEGFLGTEVIVDRRQVYSRLFRDLSKGGVVKSFRGKEIFCGIQNPGLGIPLVHLHLLSPVLSPAESGVGKWRGPISLIRLIKTYV